ncbi:MAG TPA: FAD-dependent oxidoreductase [Polyangiales bacterium]|nr:FAD-dependent oxidoreductase [Polyangiales bacterium]
MKKSEGSYEVAIIGGGPVGSLTALAFAARGARVALLEANPRASTRLAGEWLHPPAVEILAQHGVDLGGRDYVMGRGFAVLPDDGSTPIVLSYPGGRSGASLPHEQLVAKLRRSVIAHDSIDYIEGARVTAVEGTRVSYRVAGGGEKVARAEQVVGASGRSGISHRELGLGDEVRARTYSRMAAVLLHDVTLPYEGYGHLCLGALGPILAYRVSSHEVRACFDVPLTLELNGDRAATLYDAYAPALPKGLRGAFERALAADDVAWAVNQTRLRSTFGRPGFALVGDAVGHHHPLTAAGLTFGFLDAVALSRAPSFEAYRRERDRGGRVPEVLAIALYDIFSGTSDETVAMRKAVFQLWRDDPAERERTMRLLSGDVTNLLQFSAPFLKVLARAGLSLVGNGVRALEPRYGVDAALRLAGCAREWLSSGALHLHEREATPEVANAGEVHAGRTPDAIRSPLPDLPPSAALEIGMSALLSCQDEDGSWEGECVWCAMLPAEYVLAWHILGLPIDETRRRRILLQFERTRLHDGCWALSNADSSAPSLFVTTLVYVASRLLGVAANDPLLVRARTFVDREGGAQAIPTWGKFWLALVSLYRWEGVNPIIPELWALPNALPLHPSRYYCHTRLIYLSMATLYAERFQAPVTSIIQELRAELYPEGFEAVNFRLARKQLRTGDLFAPPSTLLKLAYEGLRVVDRVRTRRSRAQLLAGFRKAIRWELSVSSHTSISPVSGLLNMIALWLQDPNDPDLAEAVRRFECWVWEDDRAGFRVTGARSAIWDTSFALQTLALAAPHVEVTNAMQRAAEFLRTQQIRESFPDYAANHRADPRGGYPFSFVWHGWPVSDCTAEAILARLELSGADAPSDDDVALAAHFVLRAQGPDGGFGSYEAPRVPFSLELLNPAEMFGDSMTESGYVECSASCIAALAKIASSRPKLLARSELVQIPQAIARGAECIRRKQRTDGSWPGAWGVRLIYGTWFGVRGLLAAGAPPTDPAIRKACAWLKAQQRVDGGWGEHASIQAGGYVHHEQGQVVQTAWALLTLCEAEDPDFAAIERGARFIARAQLGNGEWPREEPAGLFFRTALLEYELYRCYFPIWALAAYEARVKTRLPLSTRVRSSSHKPSSAPELRVEGE